MIEKAPQAVDAYQYPSHRPRPAGSQGPGKGGSGAIPEGRRAPRARTLPGGHRGGGTGSREPTRRSRSWTPHSRNSPRIPACTTMPPVPTPWHPRLLPARTRRGVKSLSERALSLLRKAIENGYADYRHMQEDADLDPIRDLPAFRRHHEGRASGSLLRRRLDGRFPVRGKSPPRSRPDRSPPAVPGTGATGLSHGRPLGRPDFPEGPPITASVWHRPVIAEETRDRLAERQARAAIALLRMGKAEEVLPLLRHSADPRLRSFIVNWLNPLGADPKRSPPNSTGFDPDLPEPTPAQGQQFDGRRARSIPRPRSVGP